MNRQIVHFVREWLRPTETFIYQTVSSHERYTPHVLCVMRSDSESFPFDRVLVAHDALGDLSRLLTRMEYTLLRCSSRPERHLFLDYLSRHNINLIHAHFGPDGSYIIPLSRSSRLPVVVSWYGYDVSSFPRRYFGVGHRYLIRVFKEAAAHLVPSRFMRKQLLTMGCPGDRIEVLPWGIDTSLFLPDTPIRHRGIIRFVMVSGFTRKKGIHILLPAFQKLLNAYPNCSLALVGDGALQPNMRSLVLDLGIEEKVEFLGRLSQAEVARELRERDVFVHPSLTPESGETEGIPTALLEGMAAGLPVIATRHAGIPELGIQSGGGILTGESDVEGLAAALVGMASRRNKWSHMGEHNRNIVTREYNLTNQTRKRESVYDRVCGLV